MAFNPLNALRTGASWFISACVLIVTVGLLLLAYGLWRSPVPRPEAEDFRHQLQRRHARLLELPDDPVGEQQRAQLPQADEILGLLRDARRVHSEAMEKLVENDFTIWRWHSAVAGSWQDSGRQVEYWFVFHSDRLDLRKLELRQLPTHAIQYAFRYEVDGRVSFSRLRDGAAFACHTNGALATVRLRQQDGSTWEAHWDKTGTQLGRQPTRQLR